MACQRMRTQGFGRVVQWDGIRLDFPHEFLRGAKGKAVGSRLDAADLGERLSTFSPDALVVVRLLAAAAAPRGPLGQIGRRRGAHGLRLGAARIATAGPHGRSRPSCFRTSFGTVSAVSDCRRCERRLLSSLRRPRRSARSRLLSRLTSATTTGWWLVARNAGTVSAPNSGFPRTTQCSSRSASCFPGSGRPTWFDSPTRSRTTATT